MIGRLLARIRGLLRRRQIDREAGEELQFHIEAETDANLARGMPPDEARRAALRDLGGLTTTRESIREVRRIPLDTWRQDAAHAVRLLRRAPGFSALAVVVLALGIGLSTAVFSVLSAVFFRTFNVPDEHQLLLVAKVGRSAGTIAAPALDAVTGDLFTGAAAFDHVRLVVTSPSGTDLLAGEAVSANYFDVLRVGAAVGRTFLPEEDNRRSQARAVVVSHALWTRRFGANPDVVGTQVSIDDEPWRIVGVAPAGFAGVHDVGNPTHFWVPEAQLYGELLRRAGMTSAPLTSDVFVARLQPGVAMDTARAALLGRRGVLADVQRTLRPSTAAGPRSELPPLRLLALNRVMTPSDPDVDATFAYAVAAAVTVVVGLVLVISMANISGILMARGLVRRNEIAVRQALGAGVARLVRQLLTESVVLGLAGALLGLGLAWALLEIYGVLSPSRFLLEVALDVRVVAFSAVVGVLTGLLVGLVPARQAIATDMLTALGSTDRIGSSRRAKRRMTHWIVVPQIALSIALLVVAGAHVRSLLRAELTNLGVDTGPVALLRTRVAGDVLDRLPNARTARGETEAALNRRHYLDLLDAVRAQPGVAAAALVTHLPIFISGSRPFVATRGSVAEPPRQAQIYMMPAVSDGLIPTLGMRLLRGRDFDRREDIGSPPVAIVSESLAHALWPDRNAIGQFIARADADGDPDDQAEWMEVIGVVSDARPPIPDAGPAAVVYRSAAQLNSSFTPYTLLARSRGQADGRFIHGLERALEIAAPGMHVFDARPLDQKLAEDLFPRRAAAWLVAVCGGAGLLLAAVGLYGIVSYAVARQRRDFGIRAALGATPRALVGLVVRDGLRVTAVGAIPGLLLGVAGLRLASHLAGQVLAVDLPALAAATVLMTGVILLACYLPARRAAAADATVALKAS